MLRSAVATVIVSLGSAATAQEPPAGAAAAAKAGNDTIDGIMHWIATVIEISGVAIIVVGAVVATATFISGGLSTSGWAAAYDRYRANLGRGILLGLELLVAADIIGTVAVTPSLENLAVLGVIVLIRTFLSFSLEVEIEGRWPWRRNEAREGSHSNAAGGG